MVEQALVRSVLVATVVVGVLGVAGPAATSGQFTDAHDGAATLTAADKFGGSFPSNAVAYDDSKPQDGNWKKNEETYTAQDITSCCQGNPNVRFHSSAGTATNSDTDVDAATITSESGVDFQTGTFRLHSGGTLDISEFVVNSDSVDVEASGGDATLTDVSIEQADPVDVTATNGGRVYASGLSTTSTGDVTISGVGVDISNAAVEGTSVDVRTSGENGTLTDATIDADGAVTIEDNADGHIDAPRLDVDTSGNIRITATGGSIDLQNAKLNTSRSIQINADGDIDVRGTSCSASSVQITSHSGSVQGQCTP